MIAWFRKLRWQARRRKQEEELREELEFHLNEDAEDYRSSGFAES